MEEKELKNIIEEQKNLRNLSNRKLVEYMDKLSTEFDLIKNDIISATFKLDAVEKVYNDILKEYENRNKWHRFSINVPLLTTRTHTCWVEFVQKLI
mgnify:CR=1 FL=1